MEDSPMTREKIDMRGVFTTDTWFAWYPVRTGALGTGRWIWLRRVWRLRSYAGDPSLYQTLKTDGLE